MWVGVWFLVAVQSWCTSESCVFSFRLTVLAEAALTKVPVNLVKHHLVPFALAIFFAVYFHLSLACGLVCKFLHMSLIHWVLHLLLDMKNCNGDYVCSCVFCLFCCQASNVNIELNFPGESFNLPVLASLCFVALSLGNIALCLQVVHWQKFSNPLWKPFVDAVHLDVANFILFLENGHMR